MEAAFSWRKRGPKAVAVGSPKKASCSLCPVQKAAKEARVSVCLPAAWALASACGVSLTLLAAGPAGAWHMASRGETYLKGALKGSQESHRGPYGICIGSALDLHGICVVFVMGPMGLVRGLYGICMVFAWDSCGICVGSLWDLYGVCIGSVWYWY